VSNRAKGRSVLEKKGVFKSVLENPFQIKWPSVPLNLQNLCLARLVAALQGLQGRRQSRPPAGAQNVENLVMPDQVIASDSVQTGLHSSQAATNQARLCDDSGPLPGSLTVGINQVTRALEGQLRSLRKHAVVRSSTPSSDHQESSPACSAVAVVFVCCVDVDPPLLVDHIPHLVAACNSMRPTSEKEAHDIVKLVPLPKGSEVGISQVLGLRRAAVLCIHRGSPLLSEFQDILGSVPIVSASWLCPAEAVNDQGRLIPTHIKQLRTTAPKDMKAVKEQRAKARSAAKKKPSEFSRSARRKRRLTLTAGADTER
ncbi:hypothetical protein F5I97DRAFT_1809573, partial [Phlebopus sp. FC_14]